MVRHLFPVHLNMDDDDTHDDDDGDGHGEGQATPRGLVVVTAGIGVSMTQPWSRKPSREKQHHVMLIPTTMLRMIVTKTMTMTMRP